VSRILAWLDRLPKRYTDLDVALVTAIAVFATVMIAR
jgi:hypothetical protein